MLTLLLREVLGMMTYIIPITLLVVFILLKVFYRKGTSWIHRHATSKESVVNLSTKSEQSEHPLSKAEVQKKRMELFHHEFQLEQQSYLLQKEKENDLKLAAILRMNVTQIALKNFAWNIAFQYNISGDHAARFVIATFNEWFSNSTFATVRKNLRTTTGRHVIEIDEHIL
ncbi:hypothetical protein [Phocaeicola plebeius]